MSYDLYMNSVFIDSIEDPDEFVSNFRTERRKGSLPEKANIMKDDISKEIHIDISKGRSRRPLIIVKDKQPLLTEAHIKQVEKGELTWDDLVSQGIIEFIDSSEEENALVAFSEEELTEEHTHLEISPAAMFGMCTSLVPYSNHSPSARINAGSKNQKQAIGLYTSNFLLRMDMDVSLLHYPQVPITQTMFHNISSYEKHPAGQNIVVAVMSYEGYNMEDAIIINKSSVDRGLARSTYYRPSIAEELRYSGGLVDEVGIPEKDVKGYRAEKDYKYLEDDGIIYPEAQVKEDDVTIGKTSPPRFLSSLDEYNISSATRRESSVALAHGEKGVVDFVLITENEEGNKLVQVRLRDQRIPEIGDKFTSRHGQKGVIGLTVSESDMPFTSGGITPDIIFSPHGMPSRMTMSHLIELLAGKTGALSGKTIDATAFHSKPEKELRKELLEFGFRDNGTETLYDGRTGKKINARIFIGNMYYLKLKHMVSNKLHARARGPVQLLTRQPTEGRAKEGGLRLGEMEKDTFVAHGASLLLKERFDSDRTVVPVCEECGLIAVYDEYKNKSFCPICGENSEISNIEVSYAFKLMIDEFKAFCIYPRLHLTDKF